MSHTSDPGLILSRFTQTFWACPIPFARLSPLCVSQQSSNVRSLQFTETHRFCIIETNHLMLCMETDGVPSETRAFMGQARTFPNVQIAGTRVFRFVISDTPKSLNV